MVMPRPPRAPTTPYGPSGPRYVQGVTSKSERVTEPEPPSPGFNINEYGDPGTEAKKQFEERYARWGRGSRAEFVAYEFLTVTKKQIEGLDFLFQSSDFGGRRVFGGQVVDFWLFPKALVWRIQGEYFHIRLAEDRAKDRLQRLQLVGQGQTVVDLYALDLEERPLAVLEPAFNGIELVHAEERYG